MKITLLSLALLPPSLHAALPGAWETFPTQEVAQNWTLFDYADGEFYAPNWLTDANPYIGASLVENTTRPGFFDQGIWFFADEEVAGGALIGDFTAAGIRGIELDLYLDLPNGAELTQSLDYVDIVIGSESTGEVIYYYSQDYLGSEFDESEPDWYFLNPRFDESWFTLNGDEDAFVETPLTPEILSQVSEIGVRFIPTETNQVRWTASLDNVALTPTPLAPELETATENNQLLIRFQQEVGNQYALQKYNLTSEEWEPVAAQEIVQGTGLHTFERALIPNGEFYRVLATAGYTRISE